MRLGSGQAAKNGRPDPLVGVGSAIGLGSREWQHRPLWSGPSVDDRLGRTAGRGSGEDRTEPPAALDSSLGRRQHSGVEPERIASPSPRDAGGGDLLCLGHTAIYSSGARGNSRPGERGTGDGVGSMWPSCLLKSGFELEVIGWGRCSPGPRETLPPRQGRLTSRGPCDGSEFRLSGASSPVSQTRPATQR